MTYLPGGLVNGHQTVANARTAGFTVLVLTQMFNALNARSETDTAFRGLFTNHWLWAAIAGSTLLQIAVVQVPFLNRGFTTTPLSGSQWIVGTIMASTVLWVSEARKLVHRRVARRDSGVGGHKVAARDRDTAARSPLGAGERAVMSGFSTPALQCPSPMPEGSR